MNKDALKKTCSNCNAELPADINDDCCPKCLLRIGMVATVDGISATRPTAPDTDGLRCGETYGHYRIISSLGKGGMGSVYEAEEQDTGRRLALKVLSHSLDSPEARRRFLREGRLAAMINHPNSVYVFGTEELAGTPVIAMELVDGGTLQDRLEQGGPLPVGEAVDCIMQVIGGLEAAQRMGILHRDIKPSNCFKDAAGVVKIGDFGLSLSETAAGGSDLTVEGSFLGTPGYSSPEQLRGEELTVRSDIYSVGVTLYQLLTGRMPFESKRLAQLLATILEKGAESPVRHKPGLPQGLCEVILRCLAKDPIARFKDYAELRTALSPYTSTARTPARLWRRFLASVVDGTATSLLSLMFGVLSIDRKMAPDVMDLFDVTKLPLITLFYYILLEGWYGRGVGKWLLGLRVVGTARHRPGFLSAAVRAGLFVILPSLPERMGGLWVLKDDGSPANFVSFAGFAISVLLFCTLRRSNGYAAVHDLLSRTRVVEDAGCLDERVIAATAEYKMPDTDGGAMIGPYNVIGTIKANEWLLAYDGRLLRKVWIHMVPAGTPPVDGRTRDLGRPGRLRWITGRRSASENWDVYEALGGQALVSLIGRDNSWSEVRRWLNDLAVELAEAEKDGTLPKTLACDRVWITEEGHAKLLDVAAPGIAAGGASLAPVQFLDYVARAALGGGETLGVPLPLHARAFMARLPSLPTASAVMAELKPLLGRLAVVSRCRRVTLALGCLMIPVVVTAIGVSYYAAYLRWQLRNPDYCDLSSLVVKSVGARGAGNTNQYLAGVDNDTLGLYIAGTYRHIVTNEAVWNSIYATLDIKDDARKFFEQSVQLHTNVPADVLAKASAAVQAKWKRPASNGLPAGKSGLGLSQIMMVFLLQMWTMSLAAVAAALLFKGGLVMYLLGLAVVRRDGLPASRLRVVCRALIAWSPAWLVMILLPLWSAFLKFAFLPKQSGLNGDMQQLVLWLSAALGLICCCLIVYFFGMSDRGLHDRLSGTRLVPR